MGPDRSKIRLRLESAYTLDFTYALANQRPELKLGKSVTQSAARIQMMSHHKSKACKTLSCSTDFHGRKSSYIVNIRI